ncbi:MAG: hypothetical protein AB1Z98_14690 [Nannocystaceae bacterium]
MPPDPGCHLPPPDGYEYDDTWPNYSSYTGPQVHNFHDAMDADWTAVYIATGGLVRFRTHSLTWGADTRIKVFAFDGATKGAELGDKVYADNIGGPWWWADSKSSRIDLQVEDDSSFLIKVVNESDPSIYTTSHQLPTYTLELSYL